MGRLVRVAKGHWKKSQQGVWRFEADRNLNVQDILVGVNDSVQTVLSLVRGVFYIRTATPVVVTWQLPQWVIGTNGETFPPMNLVTDSDVEMLMTVHDWNTEPTLFLVSGSEAVTRYQFTCRTPFTVGKLNFLGTGVTEEEHISMVKHIVQDEDFNPSTGLMNRIFTEEQMVVYYRLLMEVEKAKNCFDLNTGPGDEIGDHVVPTYASGDINEMMMSYATPVNLETGYGMAGESAFYERLLGGSMQYTRGGAGAGGYEAMEGRRYHAPTRPVFHREAAYWDQLMSSRYATELNLIYGVLGSENGYPSTDLVIGAGHDTYNQHLMTVSTGPPPVLATGQTIVGGMMNNGIRAFGGGGVTGDLAWEKGECSSTAVVVREGGLLMGDMYDGHNETHAMARPGVGILTGGSQNWSPEEEGETSWGGRTL